MYCKVDKFGSFGFLEKILIIHKVAKMGYFGAQNQQGFVKVTLLDI